MSKASKSQSFYDRQRNRRRWSCYIDKKQWDHDWKLETDTIGDCSIPNGTYTEYLVECRCCGYYPEDDRKYAKLVDQLRDNDFSDDIYYE